MPLPENFSPTEHLQDVIKKTYNGEVRDWFADITTAELDTLTPRASLRTACTHQENDSVQETLCRMLLFDMVVMQRFQVASASSTRDLNYRVLRKNRPQITLYFLEDYKDIEPGYEPVAGEISIRLMNQTTTTISKSEAIAYGHKARTLFGAAGGFVWKKGKELCSYSDWDKGYQLQLLTRTEAEGRRIVEQVLDLQTDTPDWENFNLVQNGEPSQSFPTLPPTQTILGKSRKLPRRRPIADVRFQYASLTLSGLPKPVIVYDRSGRYGEALVKN